MHDLQHLDRNERVFLAGCIKTMILADGRIEDDELVDIEKIIRNYNFDDFDSSLREFEHEVEMQGDFWNMAKGVSRPEARDTILNVLDEVSVQDGFRDKDQDILMHRLESVWNP